MRLRRTIAAVAAAVVLAFVPLAHTEAPAGEHVIEVVAHVSRSPAKVCPLPHHHYLKPAPCAALTRFLHLLAVRAFLEAIWAWDNPPSPGFSSWACVGTAETGLAYGKVGSRYSSAFGMLNQAVRDRADSPASAQRILAGVATPGEERRAAWREDLAFGPGAWGVLTRAKCAI